ncbi:hypothetical protein J1N35_031924 [Gossypium stocksii]|uniref:Uncharacterized protein n=1 Tax=Gossypium stocksii TaxID=47602 RepID=A0A9D3ZVK0_9ROSI|nr:hypothetical protein J1N35_031924 [Gossypium stocksii]
MCEDSVWEFDQTLYERNPSSKKATMQRPQRVCWRSMGQRKVPFGAFGHGFARVGLNWCIARYVKRLGGRGRYWQLGKLSNAEETEEGCLEFPCFCWEIF